MNRGFTLVELLIYLGLVSLVVTSLILWVLSLAGLRDKNYAELEVQTNAQMILSVIGRELRQADWIMTPATSTAGAILELIRPPAQANLKFELIDGTLWATPAGQPALKVSSRQVAVSNLLFTNLASSADARGNVRVGFTLRYRDPASADFRADLDIATAVSQRP